MVEFKVRMYGNFLIIGVYGSIGDKLKELDKYDISIESIDQPKPMTASDKVNRLEMYLSGMDLGIFLGSNNNIYSIDIEELPLVGSIKKSISLYNNKEISAEKAWNDIKFDNVIMSGVV